MYADEIMKKLTLKELDDTLYQCVGSHSLEEERIRYLKLLEKAADLFGEQDYHLFSTPGRSELGGNHTDHQQGRVLAASVNMDMAAAAFASTENCVRFYSDGFQIKTVDLDDLSIHPQEVNTSEALIRGMAAGFVSRGYKIGGFSGVCHSKVLPGSGISSSAAFEVLIGSIFSALYNEGRVAPEEIAKIAQEAENRYFGKPCGLMDQMACSVGGLLAIDFLDPANPQIEKINCDFQSFGYRLCLVDTQGSHADLSAEYGSMPKEMFAVAQALNKQVMREVQEDEFFAQISRIRQLAGDRAVLRAYHFLTENKRVVQQKEALKSGDFEAFLKLVIESGQSSYMYLQNVYSSLYPNRQNLSIALAVSEARLKGKGAWRVHGGGLAGTIQAYVPDSLLDSYKQDMEQIFGAGSCHELSIRLCGGIMLL